MTHSWILFVAYALTVYRGTRLVVEDTITQKIRDWLRAHGFRTMQKTDYMGKVVDTTIVTRAGIGRLWAWLFELTSCHWCSSIWVSGVTVALARYQSSWFQYVAYLGSFSAISGFLAAIERRL
jgi:hypothetical protein